MNIQTSFVVAALLALAACTSTSNSPAPATSGAAPSATATATAAGATSGAASAATTGPAAPAGTAAAPECTREQFVPCETGEVCATRHGKLLNPRPCFDHAADACAAASCAHGCDIYPGTPNQIHCAVNASSTGHMRRCGGLANWGCPEKMRCDGIDPKVDDAMGTCVPAS
jgi:hypothetical protein